MKLIASQLGPQQLQNVEQLAHRIANLCQIRIENRIPFRGKELPIYSFAFGDSSKDLPVIALVGGIHGIEVIGTQVVLSFMESITELMRWDESWHELLKKVRLLFYPIANPGGMMGRTRSNPQGVDLMRNSPVEAKELSSAFVMGGHRLSPMLPWYRGEAGKPMELEAQTLCRYVEKEVWPAPFSVVLDVHSGFGVSDRVWFPFASSRTVFPNVAEIFRLKNMLDLSFQHHIYRIEPQNVQYRTHGDLWDHMYFQFQNHNPMGTFLPLCLELGSWNWVKKNPGQLLSGIGIFNPMLPHRQARTLRRHHTFLDFLVRAVASYRGWQPNAKERSMLEGEAKAIWY